MIDVDVEVVYVLMLSRKYGVEYKYGEEHINNDIIKMLKGKK